MNQKMESINPAARADSASKIYGGGESEVRALDNVCRHGAAGRAAHAHQRCYYGMVLCGHQLRRNDRAVHHRAAV